MWGLHVTGIQSVRPTVKVTLGHVKHKRNYTNLKILLNHRLINTYRALLTVLHITGMESVGPNK